MKKFYWSLLILALTSIHSFAQIHKKNEVPKSFSLKNTSARTSIKSITLADIDNDLEIDKARKLKEEKCKECRKDIYGKPLAMVIDIKKEVTPIETEDGRVWMLKFDSKTAKGMQFYFDEFKLPAGSTLHFYNDDLTYTLGAFTKDNNNHENKFATRIFPGKNATLEYFEPKNAEFKGALRIDKIVHVFLEFGNSTQRSGDPGSGIGFGTSGSCTVDVNCPSGDAMQDVKKAVGLITYFDPTTGYNSVCSGALINSTEPDARYKKALFMTAGHCVDANPTGYYYDYIIYFNYENSGCSNDYTNPFNAADAYQGVFLKSMGDENHISGSGSLLQTDYALLELSQRPEDYNTSVYYLGWDRRQTISGATYNISHPRGDAKKIAIDYESPTLVTKRLGACNTDTPMQFWSVDWNEGITQPFSSGSPLLNSKRLIGVLSGGYSRCSDSPGVDLCGNTAAKSGPDWFARMDYAWDHPNPSSDPLYFHLDPANTNPDYIDGYSPAPPSGGTPGGGTSYVRIKDIKITSTHWQDVPVLAAEVSRTPDTEPLTYSWSPAADVNSPNTASTGLWFGGVDPPLPITKTYTVTVTSPLGYSDKKSITVTIVDCAPNKTIDLTVCSQGAATLGYAPKTGETYSWSSGTNLSSTTISNPIFKPTSTGLFTYTFTATSPWCTRNDTYNIRVYDPPPPPSFFPVKNVDAHFGSSGEDLPYKMTRVNGKLLLLGYADPQGTNGDVVDPNLKKFGSYTRWLSIYLDDNLNKTSSMSQDSYDADYLDPNMVDASDNALFFYNGDKGFFKTDLDGNKIWQHDPISCFYYKIMALSNGNFVCLVSWCPTRDYWVGNSPIIWFNPDGTMIRQTATRAGIFPNSLKATNDGGVIFADRYLIHKWNSSGIEEWNVARTITDPTGTPDAHTTSAITDLAQTVDGGYIVAYRNKIVKLDANRNTTWTKDILSGTVGSIHQTLDGGYILACTSNQGVTVEKSESSRGGNDYWIVKLNENGAITGEKTFGGSGEDLAYGIFQSDFKTYYIFGRSTSGISGDRTQSSYGKADWWVVKFTDNNGNDPAIVKPTLSSTLTPPSMCTTGPFSYTPTSATNGASFSWTRAQVAGISEPAAYGTGPVNETLTNTTSADINVTYVYTVMDSRCRSSSQNVTVVVKPYSQLVPPATITPTGPLIVCGSVRLDATVKANCTYEWRNDGGTLLSSTQSFYNVTSTGNYVVKIINGSCSSESQKLSVTVNPLPPATLTPAGTAELCSGSTVTLSANTGNIFTYKWYLNDVLLSSTGSSIDVTYANHGTYKVVVGALNGCENSATTTVRSYVTSITASGPLCVGGSATLNASGVITDPLTPYSFTYTWQQYKNIGLGIYWWVDVGSGPTLTTSTAAKYRVKGGTGRCTTISDEYTLSYPPQPTIGSSGDVCTTGTLTLTASAGASYLWSNGAKTRSITGYQGGSYYVKVALANGCTGTSNTYTVPVCPPPPTDPCLTMQSVSPSEQSGFTMQNIAPTPCTTTQMAIQVEDTEPFSYHPNPASGGVTIVLSKVAVDDAPVLWYDMSGHQVRNDVIEKGKKEKTFRLDEMVNGMYLVQIKDNDRVRYAKIAVVK